ncbi:DNA-binding NarL/FixJ family response regulator [Labrenzia sp. EL_208]|nr:DNA-binding NarL/FixJ family response regulator [Labrenzia sp. EL_132]MBG6227167.1 DNA-binding NarL/FixJ family response regulator [Labrenzia sp. EL_208]
MTDREVDIILVEDDPVMLQSLQTSIGSEGDFTVRAACASYAEGSKAIDTIPADVLITDLKLPDGHGFDLIRQARKTRPEMEIMVISVLGDEQSVVTAIASGASGFLLKDSRPLDIAQSVKQLVAGKSPISTSVARFIIQIVQGTEKNNQSDELLTKREMDILWGIAKGFTYKDVAEKLGISSNTVPTHIKNIYRKLEVNSRGEAVFEAIQRGLINIS